MKPIEITVASTCVHGRRIPVRIEDVGELRISSEKK
jgi:hypothetical protein